MTFSEFDCTYRFNTLRDLVVCPRAGGLGLRVIIYILVAEVTLIVASFRTVHHKIKAIDQTSAIVHNLCHPRQQNSYSETTVGRSTAAMVPKI